MTVDTRDGTDPRRSVGVEATSLERYSAIEIDGGEVLLYDEEGDDAWIQSDTWAHLAAIE